jgi:2-amino-4-hydroxy-6-hydroxymethyldihydropteridine diphosphokinase
MNSEWVRSAVALGSNLGERKEHLASAVREITDLDGVRNLRASRAIETEPVGGPAGQGNYLNAAIVFETCVPPRGLLSALQRIEAQHGRDRSSGVRNQPRTLDLDLLLYGDHVIDEDGLTVPHPRLCERAFVLEPLAHVGGDLVVPGQGRTVRELLARLQHESAGESAR